jgi:hypothetical protein
VRNTPIVPTSYGRHSGLSRGGRISGRDRLHALHLRKRGRQVVATAFWQSLAWRQKRVTMEYLALLGRMPDPAGLTFWSQQLARVSDIVLTAQLAASDEYFQRAQLRALFL